MRKPAFCICENKDADQLRGSRETDQRLCFRYMDSTIPLLPKSEISMLLPSSVTVQPGLCQTRSETPKTVFSQRGSYLNYIMKVDLRTRKGSKNADKLWQKVKILHDHVFMENKNKFSFNYHQFPTISI